MKKALKIGCLSLLALGVLGVAGLLFLAWRAKPLPTTDEALATLSEVERAALDRICSMADMKPEALRHIGGYQGGLFDREVNQYAVVIRDGRVVGLGLRNVEFKGVPDLSALAALESLNLRGNQLTQWPDLSKLVALHELDVSDQPLPNAEAEKLPLKLTSLRLANTQINDVGALANLTLLEELDLSGTEVATFTPLLGLKLESLNLSGSKMVELPITIPEKGAWELNLDGTALVSPPGYSAGWPFGGWITSTTKHADTIEGVISKDKVEITGTVEPASKTRMIDMPRCIDPQVPPVLLEVTCTGGSARVWLEEPPGYFSSPWMQRGKVKGFGMFRGRGYVSQELSPERPVKLRGCLRLITQSRYYEMPPGQRSESRKAPDWCDYYFYLQPTDGSTVSGVKFKVSGAP